MSADSSDNAAHSGDEIELIDAPAPSQPQSPAPAEDPPVITVCPRGPLLVRGDFLLASAPGAEPLPPERKVIALCRCGMTSIAPHCDGSHKLAKVRAFMPRKDRD